MGVLGMKIFNEENGIKKVYVQVNDLYTIHLYDEDVPLCIYDIVVNSSDIVIDRNYGLGFLEFSKPEEIKFFENNDWIFDYKKYRNLTVEGIQEEQKRISIECDNLRNSINTATYEERRANEASISKIYLDSYKRLSMDTLIEYKKGMLKIPFPNVPDSDGISFSVNGTFPYELRTSLDPNKVLIYRKDGKPLEENEQVPNDFIQMGMDIILAARPDIDEGYEMTSSLDSDNKYLVIEFKKKVLKKDNDKGIRRLVKKIFNKKNNS